MKTYKGSCHCGKVRFEVDADIDHVRLCDCSICRKRGALTHRVEESCFRLLTPLDELSLYQWHTRTAKDYFCSASEQRFDSFIPFSARGRLLAAACQASDALRRSLKTTPALMSALQAMRRWTGASGRSS